MTLQKQLLSSALLYFCRFWECQPMHTDAHCDHRASFMSEELGKFLTTKGLAASKTTIIIY